MSVTRQAVILCAWYPIYGPKTGPWRS